MTTLMGQVAADAAIFINPEEFGILVEFAGQPDVPVVLEDVEYDQAKHGNDGRNMERKTLFVAVASLSAMPVPGQQETLNGDYWFVASVLELDGMAEILLERGSS